MSTPKNIAVEVISRMAGFIRDMKQAGTATDDFGDAAARTSKKVDALSDSEREARRKTDELEQTLRDAEDAMNGSDAAVLRLAQRVAGSGGLVVAATAAATALSVMGIAAWKGAREVDALEQAVLTAGNRIGLTTEGLMDMADAVAHVAGNRSDAIAALTAIAEGGVLAGEGIDRVAASAVRMEETTGQAISNTVEEFERLATAPSKSLVALNEKYGYLTVAVYQQVRALEEQGRKDEAARLAMKAHADALDVRAQAVEESTNVMVRAWNAVTNAVDRAWASMKKAGQPDSLQGQISAAQATLTQLQGAASQRSMLGGGGVGFQNDEAIRRAQSRLDALLARQAEAAKGAADRKVQDAAVEAAEELGNLRKSLASADQKMKAELDQWRRGVEAIRAGDPNSPLLAPDLLAADEASIREKYAKKEPAAKKPKATTEERAAAEATRAYTQAMEQFARIEREAAQAGEELTASQRRLQEVMAAPTWDQMDPLEKLLLQDAAASASQQEAAAAYRATLTEIDDALKAAQRSTMDLDAAQSALYDLMLSPAWQQLTDAERNAAAARTESASATLKQIELERALQAARAQTVSVLQATQQEQFAYVGEQYQAGRFGAVGSEDAAKKYNETISAMSRSGVSKQLEQSIGGGVARGLARGLMSGTSATEALGNALQQTLMQKAADGLSSAFEEVFDLAAGWLSDMFSSMSSTGGGSGGWASAISSFFMSANGNAFAGNGAVSAFAAGGAFGAGEVLTQPTFFRFAQGGAFRDGVAGEAGPEGALPLKRMSSGKLGVFADFGELFGGMFSGLMGSMGFGGVNVGISVNVEGGGRSESSSGGDGDTAADYVEFARRIEAVTRQVIAEELRPGGVLFQAS